MKFTLNFIIIVVLWDLFHLLMKVNTTNFHAVVNKVFAVMSSSSPIKMDVVCHKKMFHTEKLENNPSIYFSFQYIPTLPILPNYVGATINYFFGLKSPIY